MKRIGKLGLLLGIKESYLFSKNVVGLGVHPYKTLSSLGREKDRSQQLLMAALPAVILLSGLGMIWLERQLSALVLLSLSLALFGYLIFWQMRVWLKK